MKVILFSDADKDDLYSIALLVAQAYKKKIKILGIVCDDGFLSFPENVSMTHFLLTHILNYDKIDIYRGIDRDPYLKQERDFPPSLITDYLEEMRKDFGYRRSNFAGKNLDQWVKKLRDEDDKSISILTTGNLTTLAYLLKKYKFFKNKIKEVYTMGGNYKVPGNIIPEVGALHPDAEYNFYLDPSSVSTVISYLSDKLFICPLDATNFAPLNPQTIAEIKQVANKYLIESDDPFLNNVYKQFVQLLETKLATEDAELFLWDLVATLLFLGAEIGQKSITEHIEILWTGKIVKTLPTERNECTIFTAIDYQQLIKKTVKYLFKPGG